MVRANVLYWNASRQEDWCGLISECKQYLTPTLQHNLMVIFNIQSWTWLKKTWSLAWNAWLRFHSLAKKLNKLRRKLAKHRAGDGGWESVLYSQVRCKKILITTTAFIYLYQRKRWCDPNRELTIKKKKSKSVEKLNHFRSQRFEGVRIQWSVCVLVRGV